MAKCVVCNTEFVPASETVVRCCNCRTGRSRKEEDEIRKRMIELEKEPDYPGALKAFGLMQKFCD